MYGCVECAHLQGRQFLAIRHNWHGSVQFIGVVAGQESGILSGNLHRPCNMLQDPGVYWEPQNLIPNLPLPASLGRLHQSQMYSHSLQLQTGLLHSVRLPQAYIILTFEGASPQPPSVYKKTQGETLME